MNCECLKTQIKSLIPKILACHIITTSSFNNLQRVFIGVSVSYIWSPTFCPFDRVTRFCNYTSSAHFICVSLFPTFSSSWWWWRLISFMQIDFCFSRREMMLLKYLSFNLGYCIRQFSWFLHSLKVLFEV